jgi:pantoate--beta-alanine ligase
VQLIRTIANLHVALAGRADVTLVPTMGNLHSGHLALVREARKREGFVVVSIFVNPLQFAPHEDFNNYPRTLDRDCELLDQEGCDLVFAPSATEMYPVPQECKVQPPAALADILEGKFRPGFFIGVSTVVLKLFGIVQPSVAMFGKKDYQQLLIVRNMTRQFALPIEIVSVETIREPSGLALSSRNGYLNQSERAEAAQLHGCLQQVAKDVQFSESTLQTIEETATNSLVERGWRPDYISVCRRLDLGVPQPGDSAVILGAAWLGNTRLIDSLEI